MYVPSSHLFNVSICLCNYLICLIYLSICVYIYIRMYVDMYLY